MSLRRNDRGAALLMAVALLSILLLLALAFYTASRYELRMATNKRDAVQAQLVTDSGLAIAEAFLRHDLAIHPTVTSLDFACFTYFNGAWYARKPWAWEGGISPDNPEKGGGTGVPEVFLDEIDGLGDGLYIPRVDNQGSAPSTLQQMRQNPGNYPFAVHLLNELAPVTIDRWADVDLDEDGLRDAMWIPIPADTISDGDGLDNDLDGMVDEVGETAPFLYYDATRRRVLLTAPIRVDYTGDGVPDTLTSLGIQYRDPGTGAPVTETLDPNPGSSDIDGIDNDYSLVINDSKGFAYLAAAATAEDLRRAYYPIAEQYFGHPNGMVLTSTGEPVCEVAGRVAVLVTDEASKANLNTAHGLAFREVRTGTEGLVTRAINEGLGPHEYDLRVLPGIGVALGSHIASFRMGHPDGRGYGVLTTFAMSLPADVPFGYDISLPGYGLVDDNGDAFWRAYNGLDDDGNGIIDDGVLTPGRLEGVDEPQEQRQFRPYRNEIAEGDRIDNDNQIPGYNETPGAIDEIGEFGDRFYQTREQVKAVSGIAGGIFTDNRALLTVHSADPNDRHRYMARDGGLLQIPQLSGLKLDYNYANAGQIATALINDWNYAPLFSPPLNPAQEFAVGLRQEALAYNNTPLGNIPIDPELRAYQIGVNVQDNRDLDQVRTTATVAAEDPWAPGRRVTYTVAGAESIRINEIMVRATRRVEAEAITDPANTVMFPAGVATAQFDPNAFSSDAALGKRDFDITRRVIDPGLVIAAKNGPASGPDAFKWPVFGGNGVPIDPAAGVDPINGPTWPGANLEPQADGTPFGPALGVLGRLDLQQLADADPTNDPPAPPHVGAESYVAFQAPAVDPSDGTGYTHYVVEATSVMVGGVPGGRIQHEVPNLVQFRFGPGPGLPPGRYYLLANTTTNGNADTATVHHKAQPPPVGSGPDYDPPKKMRYVIKYGTANQEIVRDVMGDSTGFVDFVPNGAQRDPAWLGVPVDGTGLVQSPIVGTRLAEDGSGSIDTGWVMLPTSAGPNPALPAVLAGYGNRGEFYACTVVIPPYAAVPADQEYLYVAVWKDEGFAANDPDDPDLAINWFEFSQEPDHEWVEVVNIASSGDPVDMSGWQLQVGLPGSGAAHEDDHRLLTVPDGTKIAPGGSLLLAVNKFDIGAGQFDADGTYLLDRNGIGLCATDTAGKLPLFGIGSLAEGVTVPPFPTIDPRAQADFGTGPVANPFLNWPLMRYTSTGKPQSVSDFFRLNPTATIPMEDFIDRDGNGRLDGDLNDDGIVRAPEIGTADDAIESSPAIVPYGYETTFPAGAKKPWDRIVQMRSENLATISWNELQTLILAGGVFPNYPDEDHVDNDEDNPVLSTDDVVGEWIDNNGNGVRNEPLEGVDEGGLWRAARREGFPMAVPGGFNANVVAYGVTKGIPVETLGTAGDAPEWKEFVERRFLPGDCVLVTLYQGLAADGLVVDRVTYTQRDVENRSIDDVLACPYRDEGGVLATLNPNAPQMWPDNTMGVDFYRSLERKHPLYTGDRFGTSNRWEATDGNYDDWDSGEGPVFRASTLATSIAFDIMSVPPRTAFAHAVSGSPLRMNFFERAFEDPANPAETGDTRTRQFQPGDRPFRVFRDTAVLPYWHLDRAVARNRTYSSPGELVRLPHFSMKETLLAAGSAPMSYENVDQLLVGRAPQANPAKNGLDINALLATGANSSVELTCATAEFYPVYPRPDALPGGVSSYQDLVQWDVTNTVFPRAWTPIFLYSLNDGTPAQIVPQFGPVRVPVQLNFMFLPPGRLPEGFSDLNTYYDAIRLRWPLDRRAVMYVSANPDGFEPSLNDPFYVTPGGAGAPSASPAEALFVWNADDGVENGEYDVYVATADDLDRLNRLTPAQKSALLTYFDNSGPDAAKFDGFALLDEAAEPGDLGIMVEVFTDRDGNRRCWAGSEFPSPDTLQRTGLQSESFGMQYAAQPSTEGLVFYGRVKVENNYLALFMRNWGKQRKLNRFSRVILTATQRTPGRININTATTRTEGGQNVNTLMGIPGVLGLDFTFGNNLSAFDVPTDNAAIGSGSPFYLEALNKSNIIVANRPWQLDGRYYRLTSELLTLDVAGDPELGLTGTLVYDTQGRSAAEQYEEKAFRFSRMANLITTRSDVFEVIVLGQSGHVSNEDMNRDGRIDFRNDFVITGEKKVRTVYER